MAGVSTNHPRWDDWDEDINRVVDQAPLFTPGQIARLAAIFGTSPDDDQDDDANAA
jgi:hypothetical protein